MSKTYRFIAKIATILAILGLVAMGLTPLFV